jgi:hypothetical protein
MRPTLLGLACWLFAVGGLCAESPVPKNHDRAIAKQPTYTSKAPLYVLLTFGPNADKSVWLVLDKSKRDAVTYDVLYVDRNADGDLTATANRLMGTSNGDATAFTLPEFRDPATGAVHKDFRVRASGKDKPDVMVSLRWQGKAKMGGGYPPDPGEYMKGSPRPETAPVVWFQGDGPFRFQRWYGGQLTIGAADELKVFLGQLGSGPSSFCAFQEHVLPDGEAVQATLVYHDKDGKERRESYDLKERC